MKKTIVVTGGNGYIGSHMCKLLSQKGFHPIVIDSHVTSPEHKVHQYGTFYRSDIRDFIKVQHILEKHQPVAVMHFAARALVEESEQQPFLYYEENTYKTIKLLEACHQAGVKNFIFSSTCATFGVPKENPIVEETHQSPINTYGNSKLLIEGVLRDLERHGLNSVSLRYFNVAGCDPEGELGENHEPETHLIPNICKAYLASGDFRFKLFGDQHPTKDGTCVRDYVHVWDLVNGHLQALEYLLDHPGCFQFNLGSGKGSSIKEVITAFEKVTGQSFEYDVHDARAGDPPELLADISKAQEVLGFKNSYSLEECISHTLEYQKSLSIAAKKAA